MDNTLRLWDVASGKELGQFEIKQNWRVNELLGGLGLPV